jgi:chromatin remodeling complex protein RSC6
MAAKKGKKAAKKPAAKKSSARKPMKKAVAKKAVKKAKRKPNAAFMKPMTPSSTLAAVVGSSPMPRTEVTSKLWGYIKKNNLQDKVNRRMINADDKLRDVFGGKRQVSMFEMTKLVAKHLK